MKSAQVKGSNNVEEHCDEKEMGGGEVQKGHTYTNSCDTREPRLSPPTNTVDTHVSPDDFAEAAALNVSVQEIRAHVRSHSEA